MCVLGLRNGRNRCAQMRTKEYRADGEKLNPAISSVLGVLGVVAVALSNLAQAHETKLSSSKLVVSGSSVEATIELNGVDLNVAAGVALTGDDGAVVPRRLETQKRVVLDYIAARVRLGVDGGPQCAARPGAVQAKRDHVLVKIRFQCPPLGRSLDYRVTLFHEVDPAARHVVTVEGPERRFGLLGAASSAIAITGMTPGLIEVLWRYVLSGIEHIAIGYDHIAFLLAVIVLGRRFWPLFAVVTAFTVAHSLTLSLAVLDVVTLPSRIVESAIAASIVYVAAENFFVRDLRKRWRVTFFFGLVHGFGFASVLREYGIPKDAVVPALAAFNIGVEIGQLIVVGAAVIVWRTLLSVSSHWGAAPSEPQKRRIALWISAAILALGLYWLLMRLWV